MAWTQRYVRVDATGSGDGTTTSATGANCAFTPDQAITHSTTNTGVKYSWLASGGTWAITTTTKTFSGAATDTANNWWQGCSAAADDLSESDFDDSPAKPVWTATTGQWVVSGAHQRFSGFNLTSANTGSGTIRITATNAQFYGSRIANTGVGAASYAVNYASGGTSGVVAQCLITAGANAPAIITSAGNALVTGCSIRGGSIGISLGANAYVSHCVIDNPTTTGIAMAGASSVSYIINNCSIYSPGTNGLTLPTVTTTCAVVVNCTISETTNGINNTSGTNTSTIRSIGNKFYTVTNRHVGLTESMVWRETVLSDDPFTAGASHNFAVPYASDAYTAGYPSGFEGETYVSYGQGGAVQGVLFTGTLDPADLTAIAAMILQNPGTPLANESSTGRMPIAADCSYVVLGTVTEVTDPVSLLPNQAVNATQWAGTTIPAPSVTGVPKVDLTHMNGDAQTTYDGSFAGGATTTAGTFVSPTAGDHTGIFGRIAKGTGVGQEFIVTAYNTGTLAATYTNPSGAALAVAPDATSYFTLGGIGEVARKAALATAQTSLTNIQSRIPPALIGDRMDATVGAMQADTLTASALATDAVSEIQAGLSTYAGGAVASVTAAVTVGTMQADTITASAMAASAIAEITDGLSTLNAAGVRAALGMASANMDTQFTSIGTAITGLFAATMTESYATTGQIPTRDQAILMILQRLIEFTITDDTLAVRKRDGTLAYNLTMDDATTPTSISQ